MGEFLAVTPKAAAGRPAKEIGRGERPINDAPTLAEIGISKDQSARAQKLAALTDEESCHNGIGNNMHVA